MVAAMTQHASPDSAARSWEIQDKILPKVSRSALSSSVCFYSASALLANVNCCNSQTISVRPSVCPSVLPSHSGVLSIRMNRCFVHTNEDTIVWFSASGRTVILVSGKVKLIRIFARCVQYVMTSVSQDQQYMFDVRSLLVDEKVLLM